MDITDTPETPDVARALDMRQVAARLGCSPRHAQRLAQQRLQHLRIGRRIFVMPEALDEYLRSCLRAPEASH